MTRRQWCCEQIDKVAKECNLHPDTVSEIKKRNEFVDEHPEFSVLTTNAIRPLIREKDPIIKEELIKEISNDLKSEKRTGRGHKKIPTAKDVEIKKTKIKRAKLLNPNIELPAMPERYQIIHDDFRNTTIEPNSIDLILTDPPYPAEYLPLWKDLGVFAERILKPSGFLIAYSGHLHLPEVMNYLSEHLTYYWIFALVHNGNTQIVNGRNVKAGWKPIIVYQKEPFKMINTFPDDVIKGSGREKLLHDWQQGMDELSGVITGFSNEGDTILDPFAGSGTTGICSLKHNRKTILIEIEEDNIKVIKNRVAQCMQG